jgi:hypothetical protein
MRRLNLPMKRLLIVCAGVAVMTISAFAQQIIRQGVTEVGGFAGMSFSNGGQSGTNRRMSWAAAT